MPSVIRSSFHQGKQQCTVGADPGVHRAAAGRAGARSGRNEPV